MSNFNDDCFFEKLNPMVQSDLVTYMGVTVLILFLQATIRDLRLNSPTPNLKLA